MRSIKKILLSIGFAFIFAQCVYLVYKRGIAKYDVHKTERLNEILLNNTSHDIVFLGSSRVHTDIYPKTIDSITGLNSYNIGVEGGNLYEFKLTLDAYLVHHPPPKWLLLGIDYQSFDLTRTFFNYAQYFPFTKNPIIRRALIEHKHYYSVFDFLPFLKLTELDDYSKINSAKGLRGITEINPGDFQYKGYMTNTMVSINPATFVFPKMANALIDKKAIGYLQAVVDSCNAKGIKIVFMSMPNYRQSFEHTISSFPQSIAIVDSFAKKNNSPLWLHDHLPICDSASLFANPGHLNKTGSFIYSSILGMEIKKMIDSVSGK